MRPETSDQRPETFGKRIFFNKSLVSSLLSLLILTAFAIPAFADDNAAPDDPEQKAQDVHNHAASNIIYAQEEEKAIYYQNIQIIDLLKEIRDLLQAHNNETRGEGAAKTDKT